MMVVPAVLSAAALLSMATASPSASVGGHCVWRGVCGPNPEFGASAGKMLNCLYSGPAQPLDSPADAAVLESLCPHLFPAWGDPGAVDDGRFCCDSAQISDLSNNFNVVSALLKRCPSCLANFKKNFCDLTCRPDQSRFIEVRWMRILCSKVRLLTTCDRILSNSLKN